MCFGVRLDKGRLRGLDGSCLLEPSKEGFTPSFPTAHVQAPGFNPAANPLENRSNAKGSSPFFFALRFHVPVLVDVALFGSGFRLPKPLFRGALTTGTAAGAAVAAFGDEAHGRRVVGARKGRGR